MIIEALIFTAYLLAIRALLFLLTRPQKLAEDDGIVWTEATSYMYRYSPNRKIKKIKKAQVTCKENLVPEVKEHLTRTFLSLDNNTNTR